MYLYVARMSGNWIEKWMRIRIMGPLDLSGFATPSQPPPGIVEPPVTRVKEQCVILTELGREGLRRLRPDMRFSDPKITLAAGARETMRAARVEHKSIEV